LGRIPARELAARELRVEPAETPSGEATVRNRLIAAAAALLGGLETLSFVIVICGR
jgi:hypothetical protein